MVINRILGNKKPDYELVISQETADMAAQYLRDLKSGKATPGFKLQKILAKKNLKKLTNQEFLLLLVQTKAPMAFAERAGNFPHLESASNWNKREFDLLGRIGTSVNVNIYDNGKWRGADPYATPHSGTLAFISGALLKSDAPNHNVSEIIDENNAVNSDAYYQFYEQRLLPILLQMNNAAKRSGEKLFVTIPGIGTGEFSGGRDLKGELAKVIEKLLTKHASKLTEVKGVYYDSYDKTTPSKKTIGNIEFIVQPLMQNGKPQLCKPEEYGQQFKNCKLVSIVAADPLAIPGNEAAVMARNTDDGVKGMATNLYEKLTGIAGKYNPDEKLFKPSKGNWKEVLQTIKYKFGNNRVVVTKPDGSLVRFEKYRSDLQQVQDLLRKLEIYAKAHKGKKGDSKIKYGLTDAAIFQTRKIINKYRDGQTDIADEMKILDEIRSGKHGVPRGDLEKLLNDLHSAVNTLSPPPSDKVVPKVMPEQNLTSNDLPPPSDLPPPPPPPEPLSPELPLADLLKGENQQVTELLKNARSFVERANQMGNGESTLEVLTQKKYLYQQAQEKLEAAKEVLIVDPQLQNSMEELNNELRILIAANNLALNNAEMIEQKKQEAGLAGRQIPPDELAEIKRKLNDHNKKIDDGIKTLEAQAGKMHHPDIGKFRDEILTLVRKLSNPDIKLTQKNIAVEGVLASYGTEANGAGISNFFQLSSEIRDAYKESIKVLIDMNSAYGYFIRLNPRLKDNPEQAQELRQALQQDANKRARVSSNPAGLFHGDGPSDSQPIDEPRPRPRR